jgi:TonB family protein
MSQFIVTTSAAGQTRSQIWNPEIPLSLGHPFRWIAERTSYGVRIRNLALKPGEITSQSFCEISNARLNQGAEIALPQSKGLSIRIRPVSHTRPAFGGQSGDRLSIYSCKGNWVTASALFNTHYRALHNKKPVFSIREKSGTYSFDVHTNGVTLQTGNEAARELKQGETAHLKSTGMSETFVTFGGLSWRFGLSQAVALPASAEHTTQDAETEWFRRSLRYVVVGFAAFMVMTWLWPKPKYDSLELIPAQYAKIVMTKPTASKKTAAAAEAAPLAASAPKAVQNAAVVQAFRAKALNSAVSGLLKGGMTSLLAQSDFVAGKSNEARKMFDTKSSALASSGPATGLSADTNIKVASVGGAVGGKGYAKGEHAAVKGQGQAFVSMDIAGITVDEGLTKDEVGEVIHRHLSEVRYCYESAMIRTPDLEGKLMVNFTIGGNGIIKSTEVKSSTVPDPRLDDCILRRLTTWKFPNPRGAIDVAVTYPFIFKTLGR